MTIIGNLVRFGRRQLHTKVSREIIKPSSPTPSHLKTYNLTVLDQVIANEYVLMVTFYPHTNIYPTSHDKTVLNLKNSLSRTLTKYYPFAGRYDKVAPTYVDCNDDGAQFFEASIDNKLSQFLQNLNLRHEDLGQVFPHGLVNQNSNGGDYDVQSDKMIPLAVQISRFECGGLAVAMSISHKIADGSSVVCFMNDWAKTTRDQKHEVPIDHMFISFQYRNINSTGIAIKKSKDCVLRSFMFPNSKINELQLKVKDITNPTRVEVLSWLLYKCAVKATTITNSGSFKPTGLRHFINIRGRMVEPLPQKSIGNFILRMDILTKNESEMKPESIISELRKQKMKFQGLRNIETALDLVSKEKVEERQRTLDVAYVFSSMCRYPVYEIDFGWGKPVKATMPGFCMKNFFILMDAPKGDGIEAIVSLEKQDMASFQSDPELLANIG